MKGDERKMRGWEGGRGGSEGGGRGEAVSSKSSREGRAERDNLHSGPVRALLVSPERLSASIPGMLAL